MINSRKTLPFLSLIMKKSWNFKLGSLYKCNFILSLQFMKGDRCHWVQAFMIHWLFQHSPTNHSQRLWPDNWYCSSLSGFLWRLVLWDSAAIGLVFSFHTLWLEIQKTDSHLRSFIPDILVSWIYLKFYSFEMILVVRRHHLVVVSIFGLSLDLKDILGTCK